MKAKDIKKLLAIKHSADIFVPECKSGPTHGASHLRLDAWAMRRSWTAPEITGYEIKVSRSDFLGDKKWPSYLPYCNYFSFVVAPGVCDPSEVPETCGLLVASKTGSRLFTKRKPVYRDVAIPETLWMYILICRALITDEYRERVGNLDYWREWLAEKEEKQEIGHRVAKALNLKYSRDVTAVECRQRALEAEISRLKEIKSYCEELNIAPTGVYGKNHFIDLIAERTSKITHRLRLAVEKASEAIKTINEELKEGT